MNTIQAYYHNPKKIARELAKIAVRSLYLEVKAHPKPGLVSFVCQGAHQDMNGSLFYKSLFALRHYFYQLVMQDQVDANFASLKAIAKQAEAKMLIATGGINTHRGAIFALGIMCVSISRLVRTKQQFTPDDLQRQLISDWQQTLAQHDTDLRSHGSKVASQYAIVGAKAMAMQGYGIIFQLLTPFITLYHKTQSLDVSCLYAYAKLLYHIDDTNILFRKNMEGLIYAKQFAKDILELACLQARYHYSLEVHQLFSRQQISPGGVGDLIGVLLMVGQLFSESLRCHA